MLAFFSDGADVKTLMGDRTIVRAHACAAGAPAAGQALPPNQALGRSRGGFSTKIHLLVNGLGKPLRALLTPGQAADSPQVPLLFDRFAPSVAILDKAYDTDAVLAFFESQGAIPVIPPKANRVVQRDYDRPLYKERNRIERFIGKIKQFRRVFSRFDKLCSHLFALYPLRLCINLVTIERQHNLGDFRKKACLLDRARKHGRSSLCWGRPGSVRHVNRA